MGEGIADLKSRVDLAALVESDLGPAQKQRWWRWPCPFHTESRASFGVTPDTGRFKCFGCGESGDHIDYLERRGGLSTGEAIAELRHIAGLPEMKCPPALPPAVSQAHSTPPSPTWQARARAFVAYAQGQLWTNAGKPGLEYLPAGGLTDATIRRFGLGWNPRSLWDEPGHQWGGSPSEGNRQRLSDRRRMEKTGYRGRGLEEKTEVQPDNCGHYRCRSTSIRKK